MEAEAALKRPGSAIGGAHAVGQGYRHGSHGVTAVLHGKGNRKLEGASVVLAGRTVKPRCGRCRQRDVEFRGLQICSGSGRKRYACRRQIPRR